ncbi:MAG: DUF1565 domain-containing protein, partial [Prevotellaceae bacterium]|nr:DUF1565 domain-containing protein [Prevotellaceae bacterium]
MKYLFSVLIIFTVIFSPLRAQVQFHVSPAGNDSNAGTEQAPFQSIEKARTEAYKSKGDVTVFLHGATYR